MAFGDLLDTGSVGVNSITDPLVVDSSGGLSVSVAAGDLVIGVLAQQTSLTVTAVTDNLGNTYTASNAGTDTGVITGRMFYSIVTAAGTLNTVNFDTTSGSNNASACVAVFAGPFGAVDKNVANAEGDITTPVACPASGTLSQAVELVVGWMVKNQAIPTGMDVGTLAATGIDPGSLATCAIGRSVTSVTDSVTLSFTISGTAPDDTVTGTTSFTQAAAGQPYDLHEGRVPWINPFKGGTTSLWRRALSGLYLPPRLRTANG